MPSEQMVCLMWQTQCRASVHCWITSKDRYPLCLSHSHGGHLLELYITDCHVQKPVQTVAD